MAVTITAQSSTVVTTYTVDVQLTSFEEILDPVDFIVDDTAVQQEALSKAGLSDTLVFVSATFVSSGSIGDVKFYNVEATYKTPS